MMKIRCLHYMVSVVLFFNCTVAFPQQTKEIQRIREHLYKGGKPIGQPFTSRQPHIRMLRVGSYKEARDFFMDLSKGAGILQIYSIKPFTCYRYVLTEKKGDLFFTDKVKPKRNEVAILWVRIDSITIKEVHFVETIKIKRHHNLP